MFRYLGISIIRRFTFGRTTEIWYQEVPKPEIIMILIDAIEMAQLQEDLLKEDILFNYLIELLRNPEDLKTSTGSLLERRLMVHRNK